MKTKIFLTTCFLFLYQFINAASINISHPVGASSYCPGDTIQVRFTYTNFPITSTVFKSYLSSSGGLFANPIDSSTTTVAAANGSVLLILTVPLLATPTANYKVKIVNRTEYSGKIINSEKICSVCNEWKNINNFHKRPMLLCGLDSLCKECAYWKSYINTKIMKV